MFSPPNFRNTLSGQDILASNRLMIIPLSLPQFDLLLKDIAALEANLGLRSSRTPLTGHVLEAMTWLYKMAQKHTAEHYWYTNWQIVLHEEKLAIGSACFKGGPSGAGEVEAGYGIDEPYRNRGYMTEAVKELSNWALRQRKVKWFIAETDRDNPASHRVCEKVGMQRYRETTETIWWRTGRPQQDGIGAKG